MLKLEWKLSSIIIRCHIQIFLFICFKVQLKDLILYQTFLNCLKNSGIIHFPYFLSTVLQETWHSNHSEETTTCKRLNIDKQLTVVIKKKTNIQVTFLLLVICWNEKMIGIRKSVKSNQPTPLKPSFHSSILLTSKLQFVPVLKMISYQLNFLSFVF